MGKSKKKVMYMIIWIVTILISLSIAVFYIFISQKKFGRLPTGERLERIEKSANYKNGVFKNEHNTILMTSDKSRIRGLLNFVFKNKEGLKPTTTPEVVKTDIKSLPKDKDYLIWFGHSSYLMQIGGKHILVDPVFHEASPVALFNKPFKGTMAYSSKDMPEYIDFLLITHDHWDHLDYKTVKELRNRIGKVICALGVGEHFEYWGFNPRQIIEMDWHESTAVDSNFSFHCLPARHFSGRGMLSNKSLWASFFIETPSQNVYLGGDGGYDSHFLKIAEKFPKIDLAILENGQYNSEWKYIHLLPEHLLQAVKDLKPSNVLTVHHSKYALAKHSWDEPLKNIDKLRKIDSLTILSPKIGETLWLEPK